MLEKLNTIAAWNGWNAAALLWRIGTCTTLSHGYTRLQYLSWTDFSEAPTLRNCSYRQRNSLDKLKVGQHKPVNSLGWRLNKHF
jgi:hypothetical protein